MHYREENNILLQSAEPGEDFLLPLLLAFIFGREERRNPADGSAGCGAPHKPLPTVALALPQLLPLPPTPNLPLEISN